MRKKIVFVCTGNTCRSPMAEGIMKKRLQSEQSIECDCSSAGIYAMNQEPVSNKSLEVGYENRIDLSQHHARMFNEKIVAQADLILTMTYAHKNDILLHYPSAQGKVFHFGGVCIK